MLDMMNPSSQSQLIFFPCCLSLQNLPIGFQNRISVQISEQVAAYRELVIALHNYAEGDERWLAKRKEPQVVNVGIRHNTVGMSYIIVHFPTTVNDYELYIYL